MRGCHSNKCFVYKTPYHGNQLVHISTVIGHCGVHLLGYLTTLKQYTACRLYTVLSEIHSVQVLRLLNEYTDNDL